MGFTIIFFAGLIEVILVFGHFVLYKSLASVFAVSGWQLAVLRAAMVILAISFVSSSVLSFYFYNWFSRALYTTAAVWLGTLLYLLLASLIYWIAVVISLNAGSSFDATLIGKWLFVVAIVVSIYGVVNAKTITTSSIRVHLPDAPSGWIGKKAVWVSDLHLGQVHGVAFAREVAERVNALKPDIIFAGGDVYDGVNVPIDEIIAPLGDLKAPLGKFFITGNHEQFGDDAAYLAALSKIGLTVLDNKMVDVSGMQIVGVDYADTDSREKFKNVLSRIEVASGTPCILLKHAPSYVDLAAEKGFSIQLSGHTHRAQMFPLNAFTSAIYRGFDYGLKRSGQMIEYTSSGVGTWGPPLRIGTRSEIVEITFQ